MGVPPEIRFWRYVLMGSNDDCWLWRGAKTTAGYGVITGQRDKKTKKYKSILAHRLSYTIHKGSIPSGMFLCHKCDTPACVNPNHLFVGDQFANMRDLRDKGRHHFAKRLHCSKGHEYAVVGYYRGSNGSRVCRACASARVARYNAKKRDMQREVAQ